MRILDSVQEATDLARTRGLVYAVLGWGWRYPDDEMIATLRALVERCQNVEGAPLLDSNTTAAMDSLSTQLHRELDTTEAVAGYAQLFGHAVRGSCSLYELEYGQAEIVQQAGELADIAGFYEAFGLSSAEDSLERVDHVSVECEFLSLLCAKEATGILDDNSALTNACSDAQRAFLRDHLARWLPAMVANVTRSQPEGLYGTLARLSTAFIRSECHSFGITPGPEYLELRKVDPEADADIQCGSGSANSFVPLTLGGTCIPSGGD